MKQLVRFILVVGLLLGLERPAGAQQTVTPEAVLAGMTAEERVGQLFLVTFDGATAEPGSDIDRLIREYKVGGVLLRAAGGNITDESNAPAQVLALTNQLQATAASAAEAPRQGPTAGAARAAPFVPLTIAIEQSGGGSPDDQILSGLTELPSPLAIGATWDPEQAEAIGRVAGNELSALGVTLLIGPAPDVLDMARVNGARDDGTQVFGGDPYWVGLMAEAYYRGAQVGGDGLLAVAAPHFPGHGASNRDWEQEIPTVRRSLEQLIRVDLLPYSRLAGAGGVLGTRVDAFVTAHVRFQGLLERQTTNPITLDAASLSALLGQGDLAEWRAAGGVLISDSLGSRAIRRFLDSTEATFNGRGLARDAFRAGHDVLVLSDFGVRSAQTANIIDAIQYFRDQYASDPIFAQQVDQSVLRILALKLRTSGGVFDPAAAQRPTPDLTTSLSQGRAQALAVARAGATLIYPTTTELDARLNDPPSAGDRIVFITDGRTVRQCPVCLPVPAMDARALENAVLSLYGPNASGQVQGRNLQSFTLEDLNDYLDGRLTQTAVEGQPTPEPPAIDVWLRQTDWIVFGIQDIRSGLPETGAVSRFLTQRQDLARNKRVIIFSFGAPYYLDTTDLSNVTGAYYALYSRGPAFVDTAARLLFQDVNPRGDSPVSVPSITYDLLNQLQPDPSQVIKLFSDAPGLTSTETVSTTYALNTQVNLSTDIIRDRNDNAVPDGTPVTFEVAVRTEAGTSTSQIEDTTEGGIAAASFILRQVGFYSVRVRTASGLSQAEFTIDVPPEGFGRPATVLPPTATPTPTPPATPTVTPTPQATEEPEPEPFEGANSIDFALMLVFVALGMVTGYRLGGPEQSPRRAMRMALVAVIGALLGYNWFALQLPGFDEARGLFGQWGGSLWVLFGMGLGLFAGWLIFRKRP
ncbi:MAG: glycoside hydrolase family 3 protein [Anaerolineales bacterium]|nr:glycoside hydrolase family 3 protein [Anaerolineales bacterium]